MQALGPCIGPHDMAKIDNVRKTVKQPPLCAISRGFWQRPGTSNGEQVLQRLANAIAPFKAEEILLPCNRRLSC